MRLQIKGLNSTLKRLKSVSKMDQKADKVIDRLAEIGANEVRQAHEGVMGIDTIMTSGGISQETILSDAVVTVEREGSKHLIVARGEQMAFFEFGAGVAKNDPRLWENVLNVPVPLSIKPIGAYGGGRGSLPSWYYRKDGVLMSTEGYQARHGFANAINEIIANKDKVLKEVLNEQGK